MGGWLSKQHKEVKVHYVECGNGFTGVYIPQNVSNCMYNLMCNCNLNMYSLLSVNEIALQLLIK